MSDTSGLLVFEPPECSFRKGFWQIFAEALHEFQRSVIVTHLKHAILRDGHRHEPETFSPCHRWIQMGPLRMIRPWRWSKQVWERAISLPDPQELETLRLDLALPMGALSGGL